MSALLSPSQTLDWSIERLLQIDAILSITDNYLTAIPEEREITQIMDNLSVACGAIKGAADLATTVADQLRSIQSQLGKEAP